jgi:hypothetical protein
MTGQFRVQARSREGSDKTIACYATKQLHVDNELDLDLEAETAVQGEGRQRESDFQPGVYCDTDLMGRLRPGNGRHIREAAGGAAGAL